MPSGFTLIELLITLGIISILVVMAATALNRGRTSAQRTRCASQIRQWGIASHLYWEDNLGRSFRYQLGSTNGGSLYWFGWLQSGQEGSRQFDPSQGVLFPYIRDPILAFCPSIRDATQQLKHKAATLTPGYGYNLHLAPSAPDATLNIDSLSEPSRIILFSDAAQINTFQPPASPSNPMLEEFYYVNANEATAHFRHLRTANVVHVDGHVTPVPFLENSIDLRMPRAFVGKLQPSNLIP